MAHFINTYNKVVICDLRSAVQVHFLTFTFFALIVAPGLEVSDVWVLFESVFESFSILDGAGKVDDQFPFTPLPQSPSLLNTGGRSSASSIFPERVVISLPCCL